MSVKKRRMKNYYLDKVNHDELVNIFDLFFGSSERSHEYKILYSKKGSTGKVMQMKIFFNKKYKIIRIDDSKLPNNVKKELEKKIKISLLTPAKERVVRFICLVNRKLTSAFKYKNFFQVLPMPNDAFMVNADEMRFVKNYPCILEIAYEETDDTIVNSNRQTRKLNSVLRILNILTRYNFTCKQSSSGLIWGYSNEANNKIKTSLFQLGFYYEKFQYLSDNFTNLDNYETAIFIAPNDYYQWTFQDLGIIKLPESFEKMADKIYGLSKENKKKFEIASTYFQKGFNIWTESSSVSFICFVISIEALIDSDKDICKACGQNKYSIRIKFKKFMDTYLPESTTSTFFKQKMYDVRSSLAHGAKAFQVDIGGITFSGLKEGHESDIQIGVYFIMRVLFYNWLEAQRIEN